MNNAFFQRVALFVAKSGQVSILDWFMKEYPQHTQDCLFVYHNTNDLGFILSNEDSDIINSREISLTNAASAGHIHVLDMFSALSENELNIISKTAKDSKCKPVIEWLHYRGIIVNEDERVFRSVRYEGTIEWYEGIKQKWRNGKKTLYEYLKFLMDYPKYIWKINSMINEIPDLPWYPYFAYLRQNECEDFYLSVIASRLA